MSDPVDIGGGWKALEVKGLGVIVQAEMGLIFVDEAVITPDGLAADASLFPPAMTDFPPAMTDAPPAKPSAPPTGPALIAAFLAETQGKDLSSSGHYGPAGATVKRFREALKTVETGSSLEDSVGSFLETGNHGRHGSVAALVALGTDGIKILTSALDHPEKLEEAMDRLLISNVAAEKKAMDESKPVAA